jgi:NAD-dependent SIR2 family protein deacetylase
VEGKRLLSICRLRPDVVLHGEPYPDDKEIMEAVEDKLRACPGLVLE